MSCHNNFLSIVQSLVENGANIEVKQNRLLFTLLHIVVKLKLLNTYFPREQTKMPKTSMAIHNILFLRVMKLKNSSKEV